jgi:predicted PurR-regulated permease PerM
MTNEQWKMKISQNLGEAGWLTRERLLVITLLVATAVTFYLCYLIAHPFLSPLAWALALAIIAHPVHDWIAQRLRYPNLAAALAVVIVIFAIVVPTMFAGQQIIREAVNGMQAIQAEQGEWRKIIERNPRLDPILRWAERQINLQEAAQRADEALAARVSSLVKGSVWMAAELLITFFCLFYFLRDRRAVMKSLRTLVPLSDAETDEVFGRVSDTIYATVYGTIAVALVQGFLGGLIFWWLGLPAPLLWGAVMALVAIVPVLGAFVVWLPAAVFLALEGSWSKALILLAWGGIVISLIDNWLYPVLVGKRLRLHTVPVFIAIVGGVILFGAAGLILGPVLLAVAVALVEVWQRRTVEGRAAEAGVERQ